MSRARAARARGVPFYRAWWWKWWPGTVASIVVKAVVFGPLRTAYDHATTQIQQAEYIVVSGALLAVLFSALLIFVMRFPKWLGNLMLIGAAFAAIYAWGTL